VRFERIDGVNRALRALSRGWSWSPNASAELPRRPAPDTQKPTPVPDQATQAISVGPGRPGRPAAPVASDDDVPAVALRLQRQRRHGLIMHEAHD
jgi:hypothetical protein